MNRGKDIEHGIPHSCVWFNIAVLGAAAAAPTIPLDGRFLSTTATYPSRANGVDRLAANIPTRTSAGLYVITYAHQLYNVLGAHASVLSAGASPTAALRADVLIIDPILRKMTVLVTVPTTGTATDLGTSDMLVIGVRAQDSAA